MDEGLFNRSEATLNRDENKNGPFSYAKKFNADVCSMARYLCRFSLRFSVFLDYRPSQIASACLMLALNALGQKSELELGQFETSSNLSDEQMFDTDINDIKVADHCILNKWSDKICALTGLDRADDVRGAYSTLILTLMVHG